MSNQNVPALRLSGFDGEWEVGPLSEISELNPSASVPAHFEYVDLASVLGTEMISHQSTSSSEAPSRAQRVARYGDIFYQTVRPYQKNNYHFMIDSDCDFVFSTGYAQIRPLIDGEFLFTAVQREDFLVQVLDRCTGTGYPAIAPNALGKIQLSYPPTLEEQQAIGAIFTNLDAAINQHTLKHKALQQSKTALMQRMFPQEGQTVPELRLDGFSGEWEYEAVGAFSRLIPHNSLSREQLTDLDTGVSNVHYGDILVKLTAVTTPDVLPCVKDVMQFQGLTGHFLNDGDVVFADAAEDLTVGKCTEVQDIGNKKVVAGLHTIPIHPLRSFGKAFLGYAFNADSFHNRLIPRVQGTKVSSISARVLMETELAIPPTLEEQQAIGAVFANLDQLIAAEARYIASLKQAKTALLQRMFI